jgi:PAS domain S-box-containing protein
MTATHDTDPSPTRIAARRRRAPGNKALTSRLLQSIIESSEDAIFTTTLSGVITTWNKAAERLFGYADNEIIGQPVSVLTAPALAEEAVESLDQIRNAERVEHYETTRLTKAGDTIVISLAVSPIRDSSGAIVGASSIVRDLTQRGRTQDVARSASLYAHSLLEASRDPLVTINAAGKMTDVNEATVRVTGVDRRTLLGTDFCDYFTEPDRAQDGYRQVFAEGFITDYPLTIHHTSGALVDVFYSASVYKDLAGDVLGVFAAARDITAQKLVMRELSDTTTVLDNILQNLTKYSIVGQDLDYRILSWNEGARQNYGYTAEEVIGLDSSILLTPEDIGSEAVRRLLTSALEAGLGEGTFQRLRKDGTRFMASVVLTRRDDAEGHPIGFLLMSNDISEQKQAEEQLRFAGQYARSLLEATRDPLVTISAEGKITDVNEATIRVTGVDRRTLVGTDFCDYFTEPDKAREGYRQVFAEGFVTDYPLTIRHTDGALVHVLYNASVYKDLAGGVLGVFAAARDVTAQRRAETEISEQRTRELDRLAQLERFQKLIVGRELRMVELKKEIEELRGMAGGTS